MISKTVGSYKIIEKIAFGGMGVVYKGIHTKLEQNVAIKVLSPQFASNQNMKSKFLSEAKIQAQLHHPNVVNIMNFIEEDEETYLIMEYIEGETLEELLQRRNKLSIEEAMNISKGILSALNYMHSKGLVHRDIKPSNIMFNKQGIVKVTDFGITKIIGDDKNTKSGIVGSYTYMSPEHILGEDIGIESDIYSFGITLYRMVTGQVPFKGSTEYSIMKGHLEKPRIPPWIINPEVPRKLGKIILKSISRNPKDRFQDTDELLNELNKPLEPRLFFDTKELLEYKNHFSKVKTITSDFLHIHKMKTKTPVMVALLVLLLTLGFSLSENFTVEKEINSLGFASGFDFDALYNENDIRDVSWEYIVSGLAKNEELADKNYYAKSRRNNRSKTENDHQRIYKGTYTYTNPDVGIEDESLESTLKRTKILPMP